MKVDLQDSRASCIQVPDGLSQSMEHRLGKTYGACVLIFCNLIPTKFKFLLSWDGNMLQKM